MDEKPNVLSDTSVSIVREGLGFYLETLTGEEQSGPSIRFWVSPEMATDLAENILKSVEEWKKKYQN